MHYIYACNAERRGIPFDLTVRDIEEILEEAQGVCYWCQQVHEYLGLDRVVGEKPTTRYLRGNVVAACTRCNVMRGALSAIQFEAVMHLLHTALEPRQKDVEAAAEAAGDALGRPSKRQPDAMKRVKCHRASLQSAPRSCRQQPAGCSPPSSSTASEVATEIWRSAKKRAATGLDRLQGDS